MPPKKRTVKGAYHEASKKTVKPENGYENSKIIWCFDRIDRNGPFAFDVNRQDFLPREILDKMISYSSMTWREITRHTHDDGKSKHHFLNDADKFSDAARARISAMKLGEDTDHIFSFALQNKLRVIGLRDREFFHVLWYDSRHEFYPSQR